VSSSEADRALLASGGFPAEAGPRDIDRLRLCGESIDESDDGPGSPRVIAADTDLDDRS
jgi:hypothetical protein